MSIMDNDIKTAEAELRERIRELKKAKRDAAKVEREVYEIIPDVVREVVDNDGTEGTSVADVVAQAKRRQAERATARSERAAKAAATRQRRQQQAADGEVREVEGMPATDGAES